jgi:predicted ATP-grasp superfamily ATP-dependent carboligase
MDTALITDGLLRKSLSTTRSLGRRGIKTLVGEKTWFSPSGFSKYCGQRMKYPDPVSESTLFWDWLNQTLQQDDHPVFLPMDDAVMNIVMDNLDDVKKISKCLLPSKHAFDIASDKYQTMELAKKQKIKSPITYLAERDENVREIADFAEYPLIIKPRKSSGSRGIRKVYNKGELLQTYKDIQNQYSDLMIQEYIPLGNRYDVCLLYDNNHEVKSTFVQKEIRHFPIQMGPSTVQESVKFDELIEQSIELLKPLNWSGIVEVEFMIDSRTNQPILMEINPRFWNSLDLSVQCGVDFPFLLYQLCQGKEIQVTKQYEVGRRSRWLFPGDILHFLFNKNRLNMEPPFLSGKKERVYDDTFSSTDPAPGVILILACFRYAFTIQVWKMFFKR